jgi:hypothetical protein
MCRQTCLQERSMLVRILCGLAVVTDTIAPPSSIRSRPICQRAKAPSSGTEPLEHWFWIDPTNDIVFVGMIQRMAGPDDPNFEYLSRSVVYQARGDPTKLIASSISVFIRATIFISRGLDLSVLENALVARNDFRLMCNGANLATLTPRRSESTRSHSQPLS